MASTLNGTGVTFSDGSTENSANAYAAIGTVALFYKSTGTKLIAGNTISGSNLFYISAAGTQASIIPGINNIPASGAGNKVNATTQFTYGAGISLVTVTPSTGTWRALNSVGEAIYNSCDMSTNMYGGLYVRVS